MGAYLEAHKTIPADSIPLILAGFKLHKTITIRFSISDSGTKFTRPLTTVRGPEGSPVELSELDYRVTLHNKVDIRLYPDQFFQRRGNRLQDASRLARFCQPACRVGEVPRRHPQPRRLL